MKRKWTCMYRKSQTKKHKTWDNDGYLIADGQHLILLDENESELQKCSFRDVLSGQEFRMSGVEVQVGDAVEFERKPLVAVNKPVSQPKKPLAKPVLTKRVVKGIHYFRVCYKSIYKMVLFFNKTGGDEDGFICFANEEVKLFDTKGQLIANARMLLPTPEQAAIVVGKKHVAIHDPITETIFKQETSKDTVIMKVPIEQKKASFQIQTVKSLGLNRSQLNQPRFDPNKADAIVLPRIPEVSGIVDVVIDPIIAKHLRLHQVQGIKFMYECVMGLKDSSEGEIQGCILADEMGLGKSLQTIGLIWTLLKQSPYPQQTSVLKKALLVCPASLLHNWKQEFQKWLGDIRIQSYVVEANATSVTDFFLSRKYQIMIIGYEKSRKFKDEIIAGNFDFCVCDEGHRIKNGDVQAAQILSQLPTKRRVILSGTPIQNDLIEFYHMVQFVNPGFLGTVGNFKRAFEADIVAGKESRCSAVAKRIGEEKLELLCRMTKPFILRRTNSVNKDFLPPKTELVLFCRMTDTQKELYLSLLRELDDMDSSDMLGLLGRLRKASNYDFALSNVERMKQSGKLQSVEQLLDQIHKENEKVVIVSHWTQTLDVFEEILKLKDRSFVRLDGSTAGSKRQEIVDRFNRTESISCFLLSSKAGGVGLNLIGASRLIMIDIDWNPSVEQQAMARIWRDGQKRPVFIYRFLSTGTIEERIFQRQLQKKNLADSILEFEASNASFSQEELKDLCCLIGDTDCLVHDMMQCNCECKSDSHISKPFTKVREIDSVLYNSIKTNDYVSFIAKADGFSNK